MSKRPYLLKSIRGYWYYKLADDEVYHTTHIIDRKKADRDVAAAWVLRLLEGPRAVSPRLEDFARGFYHWPDAPFIVRQHAKGRPFGRAHADMCQGYLERYILPAFGRLRLSQLTKSGIEAAVIKLDLSNSTKNHILYALRAVLQEAVDAGELATSPLSRVEPLGKTFRARDVFSVADYRALFQGDLAQTWGHLNKGVFFLVLAGTGIRSGEARALSWRQVLWQERALLVDRACKGGTLEIGEISAQKGGSKIVLLPSRVQAELEAWRELSLWRRQEDLLFPGASRGIPLSAATITHALPATIRRLNAGAKKEGRPPAIETRGRNLVVHSFRHTYVTRLRRLVPEETLRSLTGHHSEAMTSRYDHPVITERVAELEPAREAAEGLLGQARQ